METSITSWVAIAISGVALLVTIYQVLRQRKLNKQQEQLNKQQAALNAQQTELNKRALKSLDDKEKEANRAVWSIDCYKNQAHTYMIELQNIGAVVAENITVSVPALNGLWFNVPSQNGDYFTYDKIQPEESIKLSYMAVMGGPQEYDLTMTWDDKSNENNTLQRHIDTR
jgi:type II secretory pathway pseudopilin PulG